MKYGFVRDSRRTEKFEQMQADALKKHGAEEIIVAKSDVDYLFMARKLKSGDSLYLTTFDRLNQEYEKAVLTLMYLRAKGVDVYVDGEMVVDLDEIVLACEVEQVHAFKQELRKELDYLKEERKKKKGRN